MLALCASLKTILQRTSICPANALMVSERVNGRSPRAYRSLEELCYRATSHLHQRVNPFLRNTC
jgi:hypothetical protein